MKKIIFGFLLVCLLGFLLGCIAEAPKGEFCAKQETGEKMSFSEAKTIAAGSKCVNDGSLEEKHWCNEVTGTWWIDLDIDKKGCNPACVINVVTKEAEINWMCTGLVME